MRIKRVAKYNKQKKVVDPLLEMLDELRRSQEFDNMHRSILIDDMYLYQLEKEFNKYNGLKYYESFERYLNIIIVPYLQKKNIDIGDLK